VISWMISFLVWFYLTLTKISGARLSERSFFLLKSVNKLQPAKEFRTMHLKIVDDSKTANLWLDVPDDIYATDSHYIPHIRQDVAGIFNPDKNKLYTQGNAERWVLLSEDLKPIGRIAAFYSKKYSDAQLQRTGGLGFFECVDNDNAARLLLQTAIDWLKDLDVEAVDGPINFGEKEAYWGLLIENFTDMSSFRMNYNPPYYQRFFESLARLTCTCARSIRSEITATASRQFLPRCQCSRPKPGANSIRFRDHLQRSLGCAWRV